MTTVAACNTNWRTTLMVLITVDTFTGLMRETEVGVCLIHSGVVENKIRKNTERAVHNLVYGVLFPIIY